MKGEKCHTQLFFFLFFFFFFQFSILKTDIRGEKRRRRWRKKRWRLGLVAHTLSPAWHGHDILSDGALKNFAEGQVTQSAAVRACGRVLACVLLVCACLCVWIDEIRAWLGPPCCNNVHEEEEEAEAKEGTGSGCSHACGLTGAHGSAELRRPLSNSLLALVALLSLLLPLRVLNGAI